MCHSSLYYVFAFFLRPQQQCWRIQFFLFIILIFFIMLSHNHHKLSSAENDWDAFQFMNEVKKCPHFYQTGCLYKEKTYLIFRQDSVSQSFQVADHETKWYKKFHADKKMQIVTNGHKISKSNWCIFWHLNGMKASGLELIPGSDIG